MTMHSELLTKTISGKGVKELKVTLPPNPIEQPGKYYKLTLLFSGKWDATSSRSYLEVKVSIKNILNTIHWFDTDSVVDTLEYIIDSNTPVEIECRILSLQRKAIKFKNEEEKNLSIFRSRKEYLPTKKKHNIQIDLKYYFLLL